MEHQVRSDLIAFIVANYLFGDASRTPGDDDSLMDRGVIDSTGILEMIEFLEANFGIEVSEKETIPQNLDSISNLIRFVMSKKNVEQLAR
jgi:acyl carrier protein